MYLLNMVFYCLKCKDRTNLKSNSQKVIQYETGRKRLAEVYSICTKNKSCFISSEAYKTLQKAGIPTVDGGVLPALQRRKNEIKRLRLSLNRSLFNCSIIINI